MSINLDENLANAICTAVTIGYFKKVGNQTKFIYDEQKDYNIHNEITEYLNELQEPLKVNFINKTGCNDIFVIAKTNKISEDISDYIQDVNRFTAMLIEALTKQNFYGAYIGGIVKGNNGIDFSGSSSLKVYDKPVKWNVNIENSKVRESFIKAKNMTTMIDNYIKKNVDTFNSFSKTKIKFYFDESYHLQSDESIGENQLFGSVHGLVRAIIGYNLQKTGIGSASQDTCCELALSEGTKKVASCIPCSIFASSNETYVNYTHLGRGDNWNFPDAGKCIDKYVLNDKTEKWVKYIRECFVEGCEMLQNTYGEKKIGKIGLDMIYSLNNPHDIAEIFLHSLVFEEKFAVRIVSTFDKIKN